MSDRTLHFKNLDHFVLTIYSSVFETLSRTAENQLPTMVRENIVAYYVNVLQFFRNMLTALERDYMRDLALQYAADATETIISHPDFNTLPDVKEQVRKILLENHEELTPLLSADAIEKAQIANGCASLLEALKK